MGRSTLWRVNNDEEISGIYHTCDGLILGANAIILSYDYNSQVAPSAYWASESLSSSSSSSSFDSDYYSQVTSKTNYSLAFQSYCYMGSPLYSAFNNYERPPFLPQITEDWEKTVFKKYNTSALRGPQKNTSDKTTGIGSFGYAEYLSPTSFSLVSLSSNDTDDSSYSSHQEILNLHSYKYSIYPILYSITTSFIIVLVLTLVVYIKPRELKKSTTRSLLYIGTLLASVNLLRLIIMILNLLAKQQQDIGALSSTKVLAYLWNDSFFNIVQYLVDFTCSLVQLQNIMRLNNRLEEKRLTFFIGLTLIVFYEILWGVCTFISQQSKDSNVILQQVLDMLTPIVYLVRISINTCYAVIIIINVVYNRNICFYQNNSYNNGMILMTLLTIISVLLQPCFFIIDVANFWVDNLSMIFNPTCSVASAVVIWDWIGRFQMLRKTQQAQSLLGRPIYFENELDEPKNMVKYGMKLLNVLKKFENRDDFNDGSSSGNTRPTLVDHEIESQHEETDYLEDTEINVDEQRNSGMPFSRRIMAKCSYALDSLVHMSDNYIIGPLAHKSTVSSNYSDNASDIYFSGSKKPLSNSALDKTRRTNNNNKYRIKKFKGKKPFNTYLNLGKSSKDDTSFHFNEDYNEDRIGTELRNHSTPKVFVYSTKEL